VQHIAVARISAQELEHYLHGAIPLSRAMQVSVLELTDDCVLLGAPLAANVNHRGTVFGGSACTLATLAAWSLLYCRLKGNQPSASVVLQRNSMSYDRPITGAFSARASLAANAAWPEFVRTLERRGKSRISVRAQLLFAGEQAGHFTGDFVALAEAPARSTVLAVAEDSRA
jgi:thioesterase domain-containing protein